MIEEWDRQGVVTSEWGIANRNGVFRGWSLVQKVASDDISVVWLNVIADHFGDAKPLQDLNEVPSSPSWLYPSSL